MDTKSKLSYSKKLDSPTKTVGSYNYVQHIINPFIRDLPVRENQFLHEDNAYYTKNYFADTIPRKKTDLNGLDSELQFRHLDFRTTPNIPVLTDRTTVSANFVSDFTKAPFSAVTCVTSKYPKKGYTSGTGAMVGPRHCLTAAHTIYDSKTKEWAEEVEVVPSREDDYTPFGVAYVTKIFRFLQYDIALLVLDRNLGKESGWFGMLAWNGNESLFDMEEINVTGFGEKNQKSHHMVNAVGKIVQTNVEDLGYKIDTYKGQSGSPIWMKLTAGYMVVGIHTSSNMSSQMSWGNRLSQEKFLMIQRFIADTLNFDVQERISTRGGVLFAKDSDLFHKPKPKKENADSRQRLDEIEQLSVTADEAKGKNRPKKPTLIMSRQGSMNKSSKKPTLIINQVASQKD